MDLPLVVTVVSAKELLGVAYVREGETLKDISVSQLKK